MTKSLQPSLGPMALESVAADSVQLHNSTQPVAPERNLVARREAWLQLPARALGRAGISQKAAALAMGRNEGWLSKALRGLEKLGWSDLGAIDDPQFWQELIALMADFHDAALGNNDQARADAELGRRVREIAGLLRG
jgi:hypothetical protein